MTVRVPHFDHAAHYARDKAAIDEAIQRVLAAGTPIMGPAVQEFERAFAAYCGAALCVGVGSGTASIRIALQAVPASFGAMLASKQLGMDGNGDPPDPPEKERARNSYIGELFMMLAGALFLSACALASGVTSAPESMRGRASADRFAAALITLREAMRRNEEGTGSTPRTRRPAQVLEVPDDLAAAPARLHLEPVARRVGHRRAQHVVAAAEPDADDALRRAAHDGDLAHGKNQRVAVLRRHAHVLVAARRLGHYHAVVLGELHVRPPVLVGRVGKQIERDAERLPEVRQRDGVGSVGVGRSAVAAEQLGRRCFAMELDPRYADVAVTRWEQFTGKKAERVPSLELVA